MKRTLLAAALTVAGSAAIAADTITYTTDDSFDNVIFGLESAILDAGLVIDNVSHVGEMLARTGADVGSDIVLFEAADVFSFCSASLSRKVMEADPMNIQFCPYDIFVAQMAGSDDVIIGYHVYPEGAMKEVEALLDSFAREAIGLD